MSAETKREWKRMGADAALELVQIPVSAEPGSSSVSHRYMSTQSAWNAGSLFAGTGKDIKAAQSGVFGGTVYAQASLAASRSLEESNEQQAGQGNPAAAAAKFGIHTIQGVYTLPGKPDRPFVYEINPISHGRSFASRFVTARQPRDPADEPNGPFTLSDSQKPMADVCFSCITTFKRSRSSPVEKQAEQSAQQRYASILSTRAPDAWPMCPLVEVDAVRNVLSPMGHANFPLLDMYRVDMSTYNKNRPITERRELIYYRPCKPMSRNDANAHIVCHAFEADRNGLTMLVNHLGYGHNLGKAASLSYSFYVHVNAEEAVMDGTGWWLQEASWPRVSAGRCMMVCKIWSPEGKHVATGYQDGILLPEMTEEERSKL